MRRIMLCLALLGCSACGTVNQQFVQAVDQSMKAIGSEYRAYVKADPDIPTDTKITRLRTLDMLLETIEEAKE